MDPYAPVGRVRIAGGAPYTDSLNVQLQLEADDGDVIDMWISDRSDFSGAAVQAYAGVVAWALAPNPVSGVATVFAQFFDTSGNASAVYHDSIQVVASGSLGKITGHVQIDSDYPSHTDDSGAHVALLATGTSAPTELLPSYTDALGEFVFHGVPAGTYDVLVTYSQLTPVDKRGTTLPSGGSVDVGTLVVPEPGASLLLVSGAVMLGVLARHRTRRRDL